MIYDSKYLEEQAVLHTAERICAAARTAPKGRGWDNMVTMVLTGEDKDNVAAVMERMAEERDVAFFVRDAGNVRVSQALVLIGIKESKRKLNEICQYCHHANCADCAAKNGVCTFDAVDVGIALGSAVASAADDRVDSRILFSAGRAVQEMGLMGEGVSMIFAVPISISGKSPFFDRKPK